MAHLADDMSTRESGSEGERGGEVARREGRSRLGQKQGVKRREATRNEANNNGSEATTLTQERARASATTTTGGGEREPAASDTY